MVIDSRKWNVFASRQNTIIAMSQLGFSGSSMVKNPPTIQEMQVQPLGWEDPLEKEMASHSSILAWEILWTEGAWQAIVARVGCYWAAERQQNVPTGNYDETHSPQVSTSRLQSHTRGKTRNQLFVKPSKILIKVLNQRSTLPKKKKKKPKKQKNTFQNKNKSKNNKRSKKKKKNNPGAKPQETGCS